MGLMSMSLFSFFPKPTHPFWISQFLSHVLRTALLLPKLIKTKSPPTLYFKRYKNTKLTEYLMIWISREPELTAAEDLFTLGQLKRCPGCSP